MGDAAELRPAKSVLWTDGEVAVGEIADGIRTAWQRVAGSVIRTGRLLIEAKSRLGHGAFLRMIESELPFRPRMAQELMRIARNPILSNTQRVAHLPHGVAALSVLARIPEEKLAKLIEEGAVSPLTTRAEAAVLVRRATGPGNTDGDRDAPDSNEPHATESTPGEERVDAAANSTTLERESGGGAGDSPEPAGPPRELLPHELAMQLVCKFEDYIPGVLARWPQTYGHHLLIEALRRVADQLAAADEEHVRAALKKETK